jgi:hypothetical protein
MYDTARLTLSLASLYYYRSCASDKKRICNFYYLVEIAYIIKQIQSLIIYFENNIKTYKITKGEGNTHRQKYSCLSLSQIDLHKL